MKKILVAALFPFFILSNIGEAKEDPRPKQIRVAPNHQVITMMSSSYKSYEEAMNRFHYMKPDGFVIESIRYFRNGKNFCVLVKLRKIS